MTLEEMKKVKQERGYSMAQLSHFTGVPLGTLQKIFSGETSHPRYATKQAIEKVLQTSDELMVKEALAYGTSALKQEPPREKKQGEYTLEDYYTLPDERRVELIDGVIYDMLASTFVHQSIAGEIHFQLQTEIRKRKGKCQPMISPVDVKLDRDEKTMVQPDVLILCNPDQIRRWGIEGAPDFVLEVLSPGTKKKDYLIKLQKYEAAGVKEYWMIDPEKKQLYLYDFTKEEWPVIKELKGKIGVGIYDGEIQIDLDKIEPLIQEYPV